MKLKISNGHVIDPASQIDGLHDILIAEDKIVAVVPIGATNTDFVPDQIIDASDLIVCPGLIDLCARLHGPSQKQGATIASETVAAVKGGITTLCIPPDTSPVIDTPAVIEYIEDQGEKSALSKLLVVGAITQNIEGNLLSEMAALKDAGCVGISNALAPLKNSLIQQRAMEYAASIGLTVFINAIESSLQAKGCVHEGSISTRLGLAGIPETAETIAVARDLLLIEQTGVCAHFCHISTSRAVEMIAIAQQKGLPVTADVTPHHLHLAEHDIGNYDALCHVIPPLRSIRDREGLQQGLRSGIISAISSDHRPLDDDAKLGPFAETIPGISGLETLLSLTMKLVDDEILPLQQAIASLTINPANILGIDTGRISAGAPADLCIFNPNAHYECEPDKTLSAGKNTPFGGWLFTNEVSHTIVNGKIVYQQGVAQSNHP